MFSSLNSSEEDPLDASFTDRLKAVGELALLHCSDWELSSISSCTLIIKDAELGNQTTLPLWFVALKQEVGGTEREIRIKHLPIIENEGLHVITNTITLHVNSTYPRTSSIPLP